MAKVIVLDDSWVGLRAELRGDDEGLYEIEDLERVVGPVSVPVKLENVQQRRIR